MKNFRKTIYLLLVVLTLTMVGCDKETEQEVVPRLTKETIVSDKGISGQMEYEYNSSNQLVLMDYEYNTEDYSDIFTLTFSYVGETLDEMIFEADGMKQRIEFTYDGNTVTSQNYSKEPGSDWLDGDYRQVWTLNNAGQIIKDEFQMFNSGVWETSDYFKMTWANGNMTMEEGFDMDGLKSIPLFNGKTSRLILGPQNLKNATDTKYYSATYTFDEAQNANASTSTGLMLTNKNNTLSMEISNNGIDITEKFTFQYEYNDKNYPTKVIETDSDDNTMTTVYEYESVE